MASLTALGLGPRSKLMLAVARHLVQQLALLHESVCQGAPVSCSEQQMLWMLLLRSLFEVFMKTPFLESCCLNLGSIQMMRASLILLTQYLIARQTIVMSIQTMCQFKQCVDVKKAQSQHKRSHFDVCRAAYS